IRVKKIELFEAIYGRTVLFDGEHDDSGQHHDDLWHAGISACPTEMVVNKKTGEAVPRRDRIPFRAYGVGVGAASWWRHFEALKETGMTEEDLNSLAGGTLLALEEDKTKAKGQNEEEPRDLRLLAELDAFVVEKLQALDVPLYLKARSEYSEWVRKGYETGKLGVKRGRALEKLSGKVKELEGELMELRGLKKLVKELVEAVQKSKLMGQLLKISAPAGKLLEKLAKAVGISLKGPKIMKGESPVGIGT
ncbi:MAG: hypothetical protein WCP55_21530, partial [Lentisphaerota bacterium]